MSNTVYTNLIEEVSALLKASASRKGTVEVSPEVAALLEAIPAGDVEPAQQAAPAAVTPVEEQAPTVQAASTAATDVQELEAMRGEVAACQRCALHETRSNTVFGVGNPQADLVFVGEAPGADEDRQGEPFVGRAGQLLTDIIVKGMHLQREDVYICNVLKCRPPANRDPNPEEVYQCEPYLIAQLELIKPKVICALGRHAAQTLLRTTESTGRLRGKWHNYQGIPLRVTYHPAYLLRNPADKKKTWDDIQQVMKVLSGEITPELPPAAS